MTATRWLIVGAGLTGATVARRLAELQKGPVLVVDRRPHVAGNAFDERNEAGQLIQRFGPHVFHTNSERIWSFLSRFTSWRRYEHHVLADLGEVTVPLPFNFNSMRIAFGRSRAEKMVVALLRDRARGSSVPVADVDPLGDTDIRELVSFVQERIFRNYSLKQWGRSLDELKPSVLARVPIRLSTDDRYFQDRYQGIPLQGYTALVANMLSHPNIRFELSTAYEDLPSTTRALPTVFTGPIDEFFGFMRGALPYRSMRFEWLTLPLERYQSVGTVNYPEADSLTRIAEFKHLTGEEGRHTTIVKEYPFEYAPGNGEPHYPVPTQSATQLYHEYLRDAEALRGRIWFAGRLGDYAYYNMDQAVGRGLSLVEKEILPCFS